MQVAALNAATIAHKAQPALPAPVMHKIDEASRNFESMFMSQMMQFMWTGNEADETFGGGHGEEMWRSQLVNEFGKISSSGGGTGLADTVKTAMVRMQLQAQAQAQSAAYTPAAPGTTETTDTTNTAIKESAQ